MIVHLIDGTYELFRHFYGLRRFTKGKDRPYGAVVGVLQKEVSVGHRKSEPDWHYTRDARATPKRNLQKPPVLRPRPAWLGTGDHRGCNQNQDRLWRE